MNIIQLSIQFMINTSPSGHFSFIGWLDLSSCFTIYAITFISMSRTHLPIFIFMNCWWLLLHLPSYSLVQVSKKFIRSRLKRDILNSQIQKRNKIRGFGVCSFMGKHSHWVSLHFSFILMHSKILYLMDRMEKHFKMI